MTLVVSRDRREPKQNTMQATKQETGGTYGNNRREPGSKKHDRAGTGKERRWRTYMLYRKNECYKILQAREAEGVRLSLVRYI